MTFPLAAYEAFASRLTIPSRDSGLILFDKPFGTQIALRKAIAAGMERDIHGFVILKGGRQIGGSTEADALSLYWLQHHRGMVGQMVSDDLPNLKYRRKVMRQMLASLPRAWRYPINADNLDFLEWAAPCRSTLVFDYAGLRAESNLGRSKGLNYLYADEVGSWPDQKAVSALEAALSERHAARLYLWISTARGFNTFKEMWDGAKGAISKRRTFLAWWQHDGYRVERDSREFKKYGARGPNAEERLWIGVIKRRYRRIISREQLAWYRWTLAERFFGDETMMAQEFACLVGATRIGTERGLIPLSGASGVASTESGCVLGVYHQGERDVVRATTECGRVLTGTPDHPLERPDGTFVPLGDSLGSLITLRSPRFADEPHRVAWSTLGGIVTTLVIDEVWARFLGYFMGDGCYSHNSVSIACTGKDTDVIEDVGRLMRAIFGSYSRREVSRRRTQGAPPGCVILRVGCTSFSDVMKRLGFWNPADHSASLRAHRRVCVPEAIFRSSEAVVREFLRGLFESDGFIAQDATRVLLFSKHLGFLRDVQLLLLGFGVTSRVKTVRRTSRLCGEYDGNELTLRAQETRRFNERIGFVGERKRSRVRPDGRYSRAALPIEFLDRIVTVEAAGRQSVYDVAMHTTAHTFSANGIVVHNCIPEDAFQAFGDKFIEPAMVQRLRVTLEDAPPPTGFRYEWAATLDGVKVHECEPREAPLRVWEQPDPEGVYVVAGHPSWSSSPEAAQFVAEVFRVWPDRITQVAEYAADAGAMYQFAWVLLHLAGAYRTRMPAYMIVEVGATGYRVLEEIQMLERYGFGLSVAARGQLEDVLGSVRHYFYYRPDSPFTRTAPQDWKTGPNNRPWLLHGLRDALERGHLTLRSATLLDELAALRRGEQGDNDQIAGRAGTSDSRAICAALGIQCWTQTAIADLDVILPPKEPDPMVATSAQQRLVQNWIGAAMGQRG